MNEAFSIDGQNYRVTVMDPKVQLQVMKRLMRFVPALTASEKVISRLRAGESVDAADVLDTVSALGPLIADTPDADIDFVCDACLKITYHVVGGKGYRVQEADGVVMNQTNAMPLRKLKIVGNVIRIIFAPMMAEIAPAIGSTDAGGDGIAEAEA